MKSSQAYAVIGSGAASSTVSVSFGGVGESEHSSMGSFVEPESAVVVVGSEKDQINRTIKLNVIFFVRALLFKLGPFQGLYAPCGIIGYISKKY